MAIKGSLQRAFTSLSSFGNWEVAKANGNWRHAVAHIIIALIYGSIFAANYFAPSLAKKK